MNFDFSGFMEGLRNAANVGTDVMKWLNSNLFNQTSVIVNILKTITNFFKGLFSGDGFLGGLFGGGGDGSGFLGGIGDFFKGLFN